MSKEKENLFELKVWNPKFWVEPTHIHTSEANHVKGKKNTRFMFGSQNLEPKFRA